MTEKVRIPQIRFKGFTAPWEQCKVNNILKSVNIDICQRLDLLGKYKVIQQGNEPIAGYTNEKPYDNYSDIVLFGDHTLSIYKPKSPFLIASDGVKAYYMDKVNGNYLSYLLEKNLPKNEGYKRYSAILKDKDILLTFNDNEQIKISKLLIDIDNLITLHQRKHDKLVNVKKSLLEKMFPSDGEKVPKIRFKGFTVPWEQCKVSDLANRFDNLRIPITASLRIPGNTPYYGANGIQDYVSGYTHKGEFILVAEDGANDLKNYPVQYVNGEIWVNNHAHVLQNKEIISNTKFLKYSISNANIESILVGGGRAKLNSEALMSLELNTPPLKEQEKIGVAFTQLDNLITLHQSKLEKLKNIKKSLLEKMFV